MDDIKTKIQRLHLEQQEREHVIKNLREQIQREERKLILLDRNMEKIRHDIRELKETIEYMRREFLKP